MAVTLIGGIQLAAPANAQALEAECVVCGNFLECPDEAQQNQLCHQYCGTGAGGGCGYDFACGTAWMTIYCM